MRSWRNCLLLDPRAKGQTCSLASFPQLEGCHAGVTAMGKEPSLQGGPKHPLLVCPPLRGTGRGGGADCSRAEGRSEGRGPPGRRPLPRMMVTLAAGVVSEDGCALWIGRRKS